MIGCVEFVKGDLFSYNADIIVNTVNCVGVMGAGIALSFKQRYPDMYNDYVRKCRRKEVFPGKPYIWSRSDMFSNSDTDIIINFPTKNHWKNPSKYEYIDDGLRWMKDILPNFSGKTIAIPPLGCGHGGLDWAIVKEMIISYLKDIDMRILVFEPDPASHSMELTEPEKQFMAQKNILRYLPSDPMYPMPLKGRSAAEVFCRGDISTIDKSNSICVFIDSKASDREYNALVSCLDQLSGKDVTLVLGLIHSREEDVLRECLLRKIKVILVLPNGIMNFRLREDIQALWNDELITLISLNKPSSPINRSSVTRTTRFRLQISKKVLIDTMASSSLNYYSSELKHTKSFYINYWNEPEPFFISLNARPVGRNIRTGKPSIEELVMA